MSDQPNCVSLKESAVEHCVGYAFAEARKSIDIAEKSREILMRLPVEIIGHANCASGWLQFSNCSREQTLEIMRCLSAGKWARKISSGGATFIDYEGTVNGVLVIIEAHAGVQLNPSNFMKSIRFLPFLASILHISFGNFAAVEKLPDESRKQRQLRNKRDKTTKSIFGRRWTWNTPHLGGYQQAKLEKRAVADARAKAMNYAGWCANNA